MSSFEYQILTDIYITGQVNYAAAQQTIDYQVYGIQYKDLNENIFNISYNNIANNWNSLTQDQINNGITPIPQETITLSSVFSTKVKVEIENRSTYDLWLTLDVKKCWAGDKTCKV